MNIKQNKIISFKEWVENGKEKLSAKDKVYIKCKNCNITLYKKGYQTYWKWKNTTPSEKRMSYCPKCYLRMNKDEKFLPLEVYNEFNQNGFVSFETFLNNINFNPQINVKNICENCNKSFIKRWDKIKNTINHNHIGNKQYCQKCVHKKITASDSWKKKNSDAQYISQNKPEVKKKNSQGVRKALLRDPSIITRRRETHKTTLKNNPSIQEKLSIASKKNWTNTLYADLIQKKSSRNFLSGTIDNLFFSSSYELTFILYCYKKNFQIERSNFVINYIDIENKNKIYLPDFFINKKIVYEIKGSSRNNVFKKKEAAEIFFNKQNIEYKLLFKKDLLNLGCKLFKNLQELKEIKKIYGKRIKFNRIPKTWKTLFIKNCRKKRV